MDSDIKPDKTTYIVVAITLLTVMLLGGIFGYFLGVTPHEREILISATEAQPIAQQKIGDDVNPDILIIYEAEVDGVKVYPSVIKENK